MKKGRTPLHTAEKLCLMDDRFFRLAAADIDFMEELINTLTDSDLTVIETHPQNALTSLHREVFVDVLCRTDSGAYVNVEIQIGHKHDDIRRCRFHAASVLVNKTPEGTPFADIPDVKVIYISDYDALGTNRVITRMKRCLILDGDTPEADDGEEIFFANTAIKDNTKKSELLQLFLEEGIPENSNFPATIKRINHFKVNKKGRSTMRDIVQEYAEEYAKEYAEEYAAEQVLLVSTKLAIKHCKELNKSQEDAINEVASVTNDVPLATITELVCKNW